MTAVREASDDEDLDRCCEIVRRLPEYFTPDVPEKLVSDFTRCRTWVLVDDHTMIGFAMVDRRSPLAAEIVWAAVQPERRAAGFGTRLVEHVLDTLRIERVRLVEVKTLDPSADYEPYVATIAFWERRGFIKIDVIDRLSGWDPRSPCAIYVTVLGSSAITATSPPS